MRLHRFYTPHTIGSKNTISIDSVELIDQIRKVFRLKTGDGIILFDGSGFDYECSISDLKKESIELSVTRSVPSRFMPTSDVYLYAALVKKDTFEWIVEKATELGVTYIVPILTERTEKKNINETRLCKIVIEASEQSGRGNIPVVMPAISLEQSIEFVGSNSDIKTYIFHTEGHVLNTDSSAIGQSKALFIGPEGGWSKSELELFHKHSIPTICLGRQVLRAETAVVVALSVVMLGK